MKKRILIISLVLNFFFILLFGSIVYRKGGFPFLIYKVGLNPSFGHTLAMGNGSNYYYQRNSLFEVLSKTRDDIIFLGDSITDYCEWSELFQNPKIKNRGIDGDGTDGVLLRLEEIIKSLPEKIFIMIGVNDLSAHLGIDQVVTNYKRIIEKIKSQSPNTKIYIQSILPINNEFYSGGARNNDIIKLNQILKNLASLNDIIFVDLFSLMSKSNNQLDEKYSNDGIHLNGQAYLVWKSAIEEYVN